MLGLMQVAPTIRSAVRMIKTMDEEERDSLPMSNKITLISVIVDVVMVAADRPDRMLRLFYVTLGKSCFNLLRNFLYKP